MRGRSIKPAGVVALAIAVAFIGWSCRPPADDLTVTNSWAMSITVKWSHDRNTPLTERTRIGDVASGQTVTFHDALPVAEPRFVLHSRYDDDRLEFLTLCYDQATLDRLGWRVAVPPETGGSSTC